MKRKRNRWGPGAVICLLGVAGFVLLQTIPPPVSAQNSTNPNANVAPFDFSDAFYTENGINVSQLNGPGGRVGIGSNSGGFGFQNQPGQVNWKSDPSNTDPTRTTTRVLQTTGGFDRNGNLIFYNIMGTVNDDSFFTQDDSGAQANRLANQFRAFIQPKQRYNINGVNTVVFPNSSSCNTADTTTGFPPTIQPIQVTSDCAKNSGPLKFSPAPGNRRQDNVFETVDGYFCKNLLGLWILSFAVYTPNAYLPNGQYASPAAQAAIAPIAAANGLTVDGTAVLKRISEIDSLTAQGFVEELVMPRVSFGSAPRYVV